MSKSFRFELNRAGVRELLRSEKMQTMLEGEAKTIRDRCGDGYASDGHKGANRAKATVWTDTPEAMRDNMRNNTLLKGMR